MTTETIVPAVPEETDQPQQPQKPEGGGSDDDNSEDEKHSGLIGSLVGAVGDAWSWITGQAGKVWDDIVGGAK